MSETIWPTDRRITVRDLLAATERGERWAMLTSYDTLTGKVFEQAGVRALLVGDTSGQLVLGYSDTVPITVDELIPMVQAVVRGTTQALIVADLPFGSYQAGPELALTNAVRHLKEGALAFQRHPVRDHAPARVLTVYRPGLTNPPKSTRARHARHRKPSPKALNVGAIGQRAA